MFARRLATLIVVLLPFSVHAEDPQMGPIIKDYGPSFLVEDRDVPLIPDYRYRVVFELTKYNPDTTTMNQQLVRVARFLNMHGRQGITMDDMDIAIVAHADATKSLLTHESYQERFGSENPNLDLLHKLAEAGVDVYVCGQSLGFRSWDKSEMASPVKVGLSAMTLINYFQSVGYSFQP